MADSGVRPILGVRLRRLGFTFVFALVAAASIATPAAAAPVCTFTAGMALVDVTLQASGDAATISRGPAGEIEMNGFACGAATVNNTGLIRILDTTVNQTALVGISLDGGDFSADNGPGPNITVELGGGNDFLSFIGSDQAADQIEALPDGKFDLNADGDPEVELTSGVENLTLTGLGGDDLLDAAAADDGALTSVAVNGGPGDDRLASGPVNAQLLGGPGDDELADGPALSLMTGEEGNDLLLANATPDGIDFYFGGDGVDTVDYSARTTPVFVSLDGVRDDGGAGEQDNANDTNENIVGGQADDTLTGNASANDIRGGSGNDTIDGGEGEDVLQGGSDDDALDGGAGDDAMSGGSGNDAERGGADDDQFVQGASANGSDLMFGDAGVDTVTYEARTEPVSITLDGAINGTANDGESGEGDHVDNTIEVLIAGGAGDELTGDSGENVLIGLGGNDLFEGRGGADAFNGGPGQDAAIYLSSPGTVDVDLARAVQLGADAEGDEMTGVEHLAGSAFADLLRGDQQDNKLLGADGDDRIRGRAGSDVIGGQKGRDVLRGGAGADLLAGGLDDDVVRGSSGDDVLRGNDGDDLLRGGRGNDGCLGGRGLNTLRGCERR